MIRTDDSQKHISFVADEPTQAPQQKLPKNIMNFSGYEISGAPEIKESMLRKD